MKKSSQIIIVLWILIITAFTLLNEIPFFFGKEVLLKTIPVDPRDIIRGDYVTLNYEISEIKDRSYKYNDTVYVLLKEDEYNISRASGVFKRKPKEGTFIKGKVKSRCSGSTIFTRRGRCADFGIESYFVKEGQGRILEQDLRQGTLVKVIVDRNGNAKIKGFKKENN